MSNGPLDFSKKYEAANTSLSNIEKQKDILLPILEDICSLIEALPVVTSEEVDFCSIDCEFFTVLIQQGFIEDNLLIVSFNIDIGVTNAAVITKLLVTFFKGYDINIVEGYQLIFSENGELKEIIHEELNIKE